MHIVLLALFFFIKFTYNRYKLSSFKLKNLVIKQDASPAKVTTDSILLGSWVQMEKCNTVLDIGTGTGILALMMARKFPSAMITGIDIHEQSIFEAHQNVKINGLEDQIEMINISMQDFLNTNKKSFDLIISNPPYFSNDHLSENQEKNHYRHDQMLSLNEIIKGAKKLLSPDGIFYVIINAKLGAHFKEGLHLNGFYIAKICELVGKEGSKTKLIMYAFQKSFCYCEESSLIIRNAESVYTDAYYELCSFYLIDH